MDKKNSPYPYVAAAVLLWASAPAVAKLLLRDISSLQLITYTFFFSVLSLFVIVASQNKLQILRTYSHQDYARMAAMGFLGCYLYYLFLFTALKYASAQEVFIINYLWPVMVVLFAAVILREKLNAYKIAGIALGFLGVYIVITKGNIFSALFTNITADVFAGLAAVCYGLFSVLGKKYNYEKFTSMLIHYCFGFAFVLLTVTIFSNIPPISLEQLIGLAWLGVITNALAFVFWFKALEKGETAKMANLIFFTPFLSLIYINILVGEQIMWSSIVGLIIIIAGVVIRAKIQSV